MAVLAYTNEYKNTFSHKQSRKTHLSAGIATQKPRLMTENQAPHKPPRIQKHHPNIPLNALQHFQVIKTLPPSPIQAAILKPQQKKITDGQKKNHIPRKISPVERAVLNRDQTLEACSKRTLRGFAWRLSTVFI